MKYLEGHIEIDGYRFDIIGEDLEIEIEYNYEDSRQSCVTYINIEQLKKSLNELKIDRTK